MDSTATLRRPRRRHCHCLDPHYRRPTTVGRTNRGAAAQDEMSSPSSLHTNATVWGAVKIGMLLRNSLSQTEATFGIVLVFIDLQATEFLSVPLHTHSTTTVHMHFPLKKLNT